MKTPTTDKATARFQVDECPDANGFFTLRPHDGTPNGDLGQQPVATVYELAHAQLIVQAVNEHAALKAVAEVATELNGYLVMGHTAFAESCNQKLGIALAHLAVIQNQNGGGE